LVDLNGKLRLHEQCRHSIVRVGAEGMPVLVVDNFLSHPQLLVEYAAADSRDFESFSDAFYPGTRAPAPGIYCFALRAFLGGLIERAFGFPPDSVTGETSSFSLVTTPPQSLTPPQRLPHADNTNPRQLALLHYLCAPQHGGTSFYRHRRTGFEFITDARVSAFRAATAADFEEFGAPPGRYICGDDPRFERIASFEAAFNRVLIYQSINLHSADIAPDFHFERNPRKGRLTVNTFFYYGRGGAAN
jgi:hypothetical protein